MSIRNLDRLFQPRSVAVIGASDNPQRIGTRVLANLLETAGVQVDGLILQSAIMDYNSNCGVLDPGAVSCQGYIPTYALTSAYHQRGFERSSGSD